ncbi:MAG: hypothetical protein ACRD2I_11965 [Vicinamibacterales bacterium]
MALALKTREPRVPIAVLVAACFGPDWAELFLGLSVGRGAGQVYSHFIPGVLVGALLAAAFYKVVLQLPGARYVALAWLLHWPADFLTAHKPLLNPTHLVGLDLYDLPAVDFTIEALLVIGCAFLYARTFAIGTAQRRWVAAMAITLLAIQGVLDYGLSKQPWRNWNPSLARERWQPHLTVAVATPAGPSIRMALALTLLPIHGASDVD